VEDALRFMEVLIPVLWIALAVAIAVLVLALLSKALGPVVAWLEVRLLPRIRRWTRARHGLDPDAPRWACQACHSVNEATAEACYRCGAPAAAAAEALPEPSGDELWRPQVPVSHFDPALYRGPGAPAVGPGAPGTPSDPEVG